MAIGRECVVISEAAASKVYDLSWYSEKFRIYGNSMIDKYSQLLDFVPSKTSRTVLARSDITIGL